MTLFYLFCLSLRAIFSLSRLQEAKTAYHKVLEIDPRHSVALGFLGMVFHLLDDVDCAIVKYHEVCFFSIAFPYMTWTCVFCRP